MPRFREEVVNVQLAEALISRGFDAQPETISRKRQLPDVIINFGGLKVIIEGRVETGLKGLLLDAEKRIADGLADISIAVAYPKGLTTAPSLAALRDQIELASYSGCVFSVAAGKPRKDEFTGATLKELADLLNSSFRLVVQNDVVRDQVQKVESMIEHIVDTAVSSDLFFDYDVLADRLKAALGIVPDGKADSQEGD